MRDIQPLRYEGIKRERNKSTHWSVTLMLGVALIMMMIAYAVN